MAGRITKQMKVYPNTHKILSKMGKKGDSFDVIIQRLIKDNKRINKDLRKRMRDL